MLHLLLVACTEPPKGETPIGASPYERPDSSNCTYDLAYDDGADGTDDYIQRLEWGPDERAELSFTERPADGERREIRYTYDEAGCPVEYFFEDRSETDDTYTQLTATQSCDAHANVVQSVQLYVFDEGEAPSAWTYDYTYVYDGDLLVEESVSVTTDDGTVVTQRPNRTTYAYDDEGLLIEATGYDGEEWYSTDARTWLREDKPLTRHYEYTGGVADWTWTYDAHDRAVATTSVSDYGAPESTATRSTWDEAYHRLTEHVTDKVMDGEDDAVATYACEGDWPWSCEVAVDGISTVSNLPGTVDGAPDHRYRYAYSCE